VSSSAPQDTIPASKQWQLRLDDQFDGTRLDPAHWVSCYWWAGSTCTNEANHELEAYTPSNVVVSNGELHLVARHEPASWNGKPFSYTSGMISGSTEHKTMVPFQYGYVEARARVPAGSGLWSALWMLPTSHEDAPEIDIFEVVGETPSLDYQAVHVPVPNNPTHAVRHTSRAHALSTQWHVFGLLWQPDKLTWYVDGVATWSITDPDNIPHEPMYVVANLAVGGDFPTHVTPQTRFPSALEIDYVRVWQQG
ncbi:MAG TPA: glycoside hydrolase family 16 protein, partial [Acidimicrobiia bacterium]|nr:glycoside hydrolase family 16 protein [Acidimicrobiia bacterium]